MAGALDNMTENDKTSALSALYDAQPDTMPPVDLNDVQSRRDIFNRAIQRILDSRNAIQAPYQGSDLGNLALSAQMGKSSGYPLAEGFSAGMLDRAKAQEVQRQAEQETMGQRQGLDLRADLARILGGGGADSLQDAASLAAVGGDDKASDNLAKLMLYDTRAQTGGGATMQAFKMLQARYPNADPAVLLSVAKSGAGVGNYLSEKGIDNISGAPDAFGKIEYGKKEGSQQAEIDTAAEIERQKMEGKGEIPEREKMQRGKNQVNTVTGILKNTYAELDKMGGMVNPDNGSLENLKSYVANTSPGQTAGRMVGTKTQTLRNKISNTRPLLINAIRSATGMSAKAMDSNTELQFYLQAATDPLADTPSALSALHQLNEMYGLGLDAKEGGETPAAATPPQAAPTPEQARAILAARRAKK